MDKLTRLLFAEKFIGNFDRSSFIYFKEDSFTKLYNLLICEEYNIFPVPRLLINDMLNFALTHNVLEKKLYTCQEINKEYIVDWKYYNQFKENIQLMLKENINCSITLILFKTKNQLEKILNKYPNQEIKNNIINSTKLPQRDCIYLFR